MSVGNQCINCARFTPSDIARCKAYPKGIPEEIFSGRVGHTKPYAGDHDIQFKERPDVKKSTPVLTMTGTDPRPDGDYDPAELAAGIKTEMEHTSDSAIAKKIAKDHLDEDAQYYVHLIEMEQEHKNDEVKGRLH